MSANEIIKHSGKIFGIIKSEDFKLGHKIREVSIEILIIVFAISLSLVLERWRQNQDDHQLERRFLTALKTDLTHDLEELKVSSAKSISMRDAAQYFLRPQKNINWASDSVRTNMYALFHNIYFFPNFNRYESLKSTGKLEVIEDEELQNDIIDLYQTRIPDLEEQINFFNQFMNTQVKEYLIHHLKRDANNQVIADKAFFDPPEIKNMLALYTDLDDVLKRADASEKESKKILARIDQVLNK